MLHTSNVIIFTETHVALSGYSDSRSCMQLILLFREMQVAGAGCNLPPRNHVKEALLGKVSARRQGQEVDVNTGASVFFRRFCAIMN